MHENIPSGAYFTLTGVQKHHRGWTLEPITKEEYYAHYQCNTNNECQIVWEFLKNIYDIRIENPLNVYDDGMHVYFIEVEHKREIYLDAAYVRTVCEVENPYGLEITANLQNKYFIVKRPEDFIDENFG